MPGADAAGGNSNAFRRIVTSFRTELIRSNFISLAYNGTRLSTATRSFLFGKPIHQDAKNGLSRQQSNWLTGSSSSGAQLVR
jgi:hypothetical protein